MVHIYNRKLVSHKKERNNAICRNMDVNRDYHTKSVRKRKTNTIYHLYMESKICHKWTYLQNRKRLTDIENRLVVAKWGGGKGKDWEFGVSRWKLLCIEWIDNKVLLYSTGNYTEYPVINHNGKEYFKKYI